MSRSGIRRKSVNVLSLDELKSEKDRCSAILACDCCKQVQKSLNKRLALIKERLEALDF